MSIGNKVGSAKRLKKQLAAAKAARERQFVSYLKQDQEMEVRFLTEPDEWWQYGEHFDRTNKFFPCVGIEGDCEGCLAGENPSKRFLANVLDIDTGNVVPLKLPMTLVNRLAARYDRHGTLTDRDFILFREGSGMDTTYDYEAGDKSKLKLSRYEESMHDLEEVLYGEWESKFGGDTDDDEEEEERPKSGRRLKRDAKSKSKRSRRRARDEDEDRDDEEDDEEEEAPRSRRSRRSRPERSRRSRRARDEDDDEDEADEPDEDEDEEEEEERPRRSRGRRSRRSEPDEDEDDDEYDDEDEEDPDDDDDEDEPDDDDDEEVITEEELQKMERQQVKALANKLEVDYKPRAHTQTIREAILDAAAEEE